METLVANLTGSVRRRHDRGDEYLVVPMTLIVPGVLDGSLGPLYYPAEEIARNVEAWNGIPLTLGHPTKDGRMISAEDPSAIRLGFVRNATIRDDRLRADGWFSVERLMRADPSLLGSLNSGRPAELSTGLHANKEPVEGESFGGKSYTHVARDYEPDHLAILVDQKGACSIEDGCGVLINAGTTLIGFTGTATGHLHSVTVGDRGGGMANHQDGHWHFIERFVVAVEDGHTHSLDQKSLVDSGIRNAEENRKEGDMALSEKVKKEMVDGIIADVCCWDEGDRGVLNGLSDAKLKKMADDQTSREQTELVANAAREGFQDQRGNSHAYDPKKGKWESQIKEEEPAADPKPVANEKPAEVTFEELWKKAPPEIQSAVVNAQRIEAREKGALIERLTTNVEPDKLQAVAETLGRKPLTELEMLVNLLPSVDPVPPPSYFGAATPGGSAPVANELDQEDILPLPIMNWAKAE